MRQTLRHIIILITSVATIFATSCNKQTDPKENAPAPQTLMFYFTGTQLSYYFARNIDAVAEAVARGNAGDCRILCFYQGSDRNSGSIIELVNRNGNCIRQNLATYEMPPIAEGEDMTFFISEMMRLAPAESYGLVLAGHATAWIPAPAASATAAKRPDIVSPDYWRKAPSNVVTRYFGEIYSASASNYFEIETIADALTATGEKFRYMLIDACFMANVESAYILRNAANYIIGAPCEVLGNGFPYTEVLPHLLAGNGLTPDIDGACRAFHDYYDAEYGYSGSVAAIDCSQLEALAAVMKQLNTSGAMAEPDIKKLQTYEGQVQHLFYDLGDYVDKACSDETLKAAFKEQMNRSVPYKYTLDAFWSNYGVPGRYNINTETYSGLSTSAPAEIYRYEYGLTQWYEATH